MTVFGLAIVYMVCSNTERGDIQPHDIIITRTKDDSPPPHNVKWEWLETFRVARSPLLSAQWWYGRSEESPFQKHIRYRKVCQTWFWLPLVPICLTVESWHENDLKLSGLLAHRYFPPNDDKVAQTSRHFKSFRVCQRLLWLPLVPICLTYPEMIVEMQRIHHSHL